MSYVCTVHIYSDKVRIAANYENSANYYVIDLLEATLEWCGNSNKFVHKEKTI